MIHNCPTCVCDSMTEDEWRNAMNLTDERWSGVHFWFDDNLTGGQACANFPCRRAIGQKRV